MIVNVLCLFPEMLSSLSHSLMGRAQSEGRLKINAINIRDFAVDNYKSVDDTPYGGGAGQVMRADIISRAIESIPVEERGRLIFLSPRGEKFSQPMAEGLSKLPYITLLCGHYEGVDERVLEYYGFDEVSVGDYVLSGGEAAAIPLIDSVARLIPGVLGNENSLVNESFGREIEGGLEYPQYTRPEEWNGLKVPGVLISGHHANIEKWRREESRKLTRLRRPDLFRKED